MPNIETIIKRGSRFRAEMVDDHLVVWLTEPPERGRANAELVKELSALTGGQVLILKGKTSKRKLLKLSGQTSKIAYANQRTARAT